MIRMTLLAAALLLAVFPCVADDHASPETAEAQIEKLLAASAAAWSRGDLESFVQYYAEDATFISPTGITKGRQAVLDRYRKRYPDRAAMGTLTLDTKEVRLAANGASASVVARWTLDYPDGAERKQATGLTLIVFQKTDKGWLIIQDASM